MKLSKTKLTAFAAIVYGIAGYFTGNLDGNTAIQTGLAGAAVFGFRDAISKVTDVLNKLK